MKLYKVESSNIEAVGFRLKEDSVPVSKGAAVKGILRIKFLSSADAFYDYFDVPVETYIDFRMADSKGKFFAANIKTKFSYKKVEGENG